MLKETAIEKLAKLIKVKPEDLKLAIEAQTETDIAIPENILVFTKDEIDTRDANIKTQSYKDGTIAGVEMNVKELKEQLGYDFQGKSIKGLIDHHEKKVLEKAKVEPNEQVKLMQGQVTDLQTKLQLFDVEKNNLLSELNNTKLSTKIITSLPFIPKGMNQDDVLLIVKNNLQVENVDGKEIVKMNGEPLKSEKDASFLSLKDGLNKFYEVKGWQNEAAGGTGGRGGNDKTPGSGNIKAKTFSEAKEAWIKAGNKEGSENTPAFQAFVGEQAKDNPDFKFD